MIEKLTNKQIARFPEFKDKWISIGLDTKKANRSVAEEACRQAYIVAGLEPPKIILWAESPLSLLLTAKLIKEISKKGYKPYSEMDLSSVWASVGDSVWASVWDGVGDSVWASVRASVWDGVGASVWDGVGDSVGDSVWASVRASVWDGVGDSVWDGVRASVGASVGDSVRASVWDGVRASGLREEWNDCGSWGQHDAGWLSFYDYFKDVCNLELCKKLEPLINLAKETGWHLFYKNIAILSEKPIELHRNTQGRLHKTDGPAIKWADGYELYRLNGVRLDGKDWVIHQKPEDFTKQQIMEEKNADIRREIIRKITPKKALDMLGGKVIHKRDYTGMLGFETHAGRNYELLETDWGTGSKRYYLKMIYPNFGHTIIEAVHPDCRTVDMALGFRDPIINKTDAWKKKEYVYLAPIYLT